MCDYSLQAVRSRPAVVGERLVVTDFGTGTRGFAPESGEDVAVCVLPGTELAFDKPIMGASISKQAGHTLAIFRQIDRNIERTHHDAIEIPGWDGPSHLVHGRVATGYHLLTLLQPGQRARVLQLPAHPVTAAEAEAQRRVEYAG